VTVTVRDAVLGAFRWVDGHADVWRLFHDAEVFRLVVGHLVEQASSSEATKIAGIESRGFILGAAVAAGAGIGFAPIRKEAGLFPGEKDCVTADADYRGQRHVLRLQRNSITAGEGVLLVDDWAEVGSQAVAARQLIEGCGGTWLGAALIVDQLPDDRRQQLAPVSHIVTADELGPSE
jgi:adenine phosphoribosyltransferase